MGRMRVFEQIIKENAEAVASSQGLNASQGLNGQVRGSSPSRKRFQASLNEGDADENVNDCQ